MQPFASPAPREKSLKVFQGKVSFSVWSYRLVPWVMFYSSLVPTPSARRTSVKCRQLSNVLLMLLFWKYNCFCSWHDWQRQVFKSKELQDFSLDSQAVVNINRQFSILICNRWVWALRLLIKWPVPAVAWRWVQMWWLSLLQMEDSLPFCLQLVTALEKEKLMCAQGLEGMLIPFRRHGGVTPAVISCCQE